MPETDENKALECMSDAVLEIDDEDPNRINARMSCADNSEYRITWTGHTGTDRGYHVFDGDVRSGRWQSNYNYTGTNGRYEVGNSDLPPTIDENNETFLGEWIQIELPNPKAIESYTMTCGTDYAPMRKDVDGFPGAWVVLGSMTGDNRSWVRVHGGAMNQAGWENSGSYVIDGEPEDDHPFFIRSVDTGRYVASSAEGENLDRNTLCDHEERIGDSGNYTTAYVETINDSNRSRATFIRNLYEGDSGYYNGRYVANHFLLDNADKCGWKSRGHPSDRRPLAFLTVDHNYDVTYFYKAQWRNAQIRFEGPDSSMPLTSQKLQRGTDFHKYMSTRSGVFEEHQSYRGNRVGGGPSSGKRPETYHWVLETEDRDQAKWIVGANTTSGKIESSVAYKYYRIVFQSAAGGSSIVLNNLAIKFKDRTSAAAMRAFFSEWGLWIVLGVVGIIVLVIVFV